MDIINAIIALVSGAVGGNVAGKAMPEKDMGPLINTIIGLVGGGGTDFILKFLGVIASASTTAHGAGSGELDLASILTTIGVSGVSGGVLTAIIALIKSAFEKR